MSDDTEKEVERRRDAALLRALSTPHKKQKEMKVGRGGLKAAGDDPPSTHKKERS